MKENLTLNQAILLLVLFLLGSSVVLGINTDASRDSWIALIMAILISLPLIIMYARIIILHPGKNLFDIVDILFGKLIGKILTTLMAIYAVILGALVLRNFTEYISITTLLYTPSILIGILLLLVTVNLAKSGAKVLGGWAIFTFFGITIFILSTLFLSIETFDIESLFPIMEHGIGDITKSSLKIVAFPFAEMVLFLCIANFFKKGDSPYKIYLTGLFIGGTILLLISLRNVMAIGIPSFTEAYFPSYIAARFIQLGDFLTKVEGIITINFIITGITKLAVCLLTASMGVRHLLRVKNYKDVIVPTSLIILSLSAIIFSNIVEMTNFEKNYYIFAFPFQIIIPLIIWIFSEIKKPKKEH
jgi:spore germination protein KB